MVSGERQNYLTQSIIETIDMLSIQGEQNMNSLRLHIQNPETIETYFKLLELFILVTVSGRRRLHYTRIAGGIAANKHPKCNFSTLQDRTHTANSSANWHDLAAHQTIGRTLEKCTPHLCRRTHPIQISPHQDTAPIPKSTRSDSANCRAEHTTCKQAKETAGERVAKDNK